jgi:hypothetical protein
MAAPAQLFGHVCKNPGNGTFQIWPEAPALSVRYGPGRMFSTITVVQPDPAVALSGQLAFTLGDNTAYIALHAGQRFLGLGWSVPMLMLEVTGAVAGEDWSMILM